MSLAVVSRARGFHSKLKKCVAAPALSMEITAAATARQVEEENYNTCDQLFP